MKRGWSVGMVAMVAGSALAAAPKVSVKLPPSGVRPAPPQLQPGCVDGSFVPALQAIKLTESCADAIVWFAQASVGGKQLTAVIENRSKDGSFGGMLRPKKSSRGCTRHCPQGALYVGSRHFDQYDMEELRKALPNLAKLTDPDAEVFLALARVLYMNDGDLPRLGFDVAGSIILSAVWAPVVNRGDWPPFIIDPRRLRMTKTEKGRAVMGWYEGNRLYDGRECLTAHQIEVTLTPEGQILVATSDLEGRGPGCPVYQPDPPNIFPD